MTTPHAQPADDWIAVLSGDPPDPGYFGPGSITWRIMGDPAMVVAGLRTILLQALHPSAMDGVARYSNFEADPWGRLIRTGNYLGVTTYGSRPEADEISAHVRGIHSRLSRVSQLEPTTGRSYRVEDQELLRWVHITEIDSFLSVARRSGVPLTDAEADRYVLEQQEGARLIGVDPSTVPTTAAGVRAVPADEAVGRPGHTRAAGVDRYRDPGLRDAAPVGPAHARFPWCATDRRGCHIGGAGAAECAAASARFTSGRSAPRCRARAACPLDRFPLTPSKDGYDAEGQPGVDAHEANEPVAVPCTQRDAHPRSTRLHVLPSRHSQPVDVCLRQRLAPPTR